MTNPWFRMHSKVLNNPKAQKLDGETFKVWVNLLCVTNDDVSSTIYETKLDDISWLLRVSPKMLQGTIQTLLDADLLIEVEGGYQPKDWHEWQYSTENSGSSTARVKKHRDKKRREGDVSSSVSPPVSKSVTETPPDTDSEADTEPDSEEKKASPPNKPFEVDPSKPHFEELSLYGDFLTALECQDNFQMAGKFGIFQSWIKYGCDYHLDILPTAKVVQVRQKSKKQTITMGYLTPCVQSAHDERIQTGKSSASLGVSHETVSPEKWADRVLNFELDSEHWSRNWGPKPGEAGCHVPQEVLDKFTEKRRETV